MLNLEHLAGLVHAWLMKQKQTSIVVACRGRGMTNITPQIQHWLSETAIQTGVLAVFIQHTSCSLIIQENADPDVLIDLENFMGHLVPDGHPDFRHVDEGMDDMSAHIRVALTQVSLSIPVLDGKAALGIWQAVYVYEHRFSAMQRRVLLHVVGE